MTTDFVNPLLILEEFISVTSIHEELKIFLISHCIPPKENIWTLESKNKYIFPLKERGHGVTVSWCLVHNTYSVRTKTQIKKGKMRQVIYMVCWKKSGVATSFYILPLFYSKLKVMRWILYSCNCIASKLL